MRLFLISEDDFDDIEWEWTDEEVRARALLDIAAGVGYKFIEAMGETSGESIYDLYVLSLNPELWGVYKWGRHLQESDSYVIAYEFNQELTDLNRDGRLIYEGAYENLEDDDRFNEGERWPPWSEVDWLPETLNRLIDGRPEVLERLEEIVEAIQEGYEINRGDAPRLD
jgi:hypothetical protein